jgi:hypothetical protein
MTATERGRRILHSLEGLTEFLRVFAQKHHAIDDKQCGCGWHADQTGTLFRHTWSEHYNRLLMAELGGALPSTTWPPGATEPLSLNELIANLRLDLDERDAERDGTQFPEQGRTAAAVALAKALEQYGFAYSSRRYPAVECTNPSITVYVTPRGYQIRSPIPDGDPDIPCVCELPASAPLPAVEHAVLALYRSSVATVAPDPVTFEWVLTFTPDGGESVEIPFDVSVEHNGVTGIFDLATREVTE